MRLKYDFANGRSEIWSVKLMDAARNRDSVSWKVCEDEADGSGGTETWSWAEEWESQCWS